MFGNRTNEDKRGARELRGESMRRGKKENPSSPGSIVDWADRVIFNIRSGDKRSGQKRISPKKIIAILTLTMLFALTALYCIYK